jgi:hypothetical protein
MVGVGEAAASAALRMPKSATAIAQQAIIADIGVRNVFKIVLLIRVRAGIREGGVPCLELFACSRLQGLAIMTAS